MTIIYFDFQRPPFTILKIENKKIVGTSGFCFEILKELARKLNFT